MTVAILLLGCFTLPLASCGHKGKLKTPAQAARDAEKKQRELEKRQREEAELQQQVESQREVPPPTILEESAKPSGLPPEQDTPPLMGGEPEFEETDQSNPLPLGVQVQP